MDGCLVDVSIRRKLSKEIEARAICTSPSSSLLLAMDTVDDNFQLMPRCLLVTLECDSYE